MTKLLDVDDAFPTELRRSSNEHLQIARRHGWLATDLARLAEGWRPTTVFLATMPTIADAYIDLNGGSAKLVGFVIGDGRRRLYTEEPLAALSSRDGWARTDGRWLRIICRPGR